MVAGRMPQLVHRTRSLPRRRACRACVELACLRFVYRTGVNLVEVGFCYPFAGAQAERCGDPEPLPLRSERGVEKPRPTLRCCHVRLPERRIGSESKMPRLRLSETPASHGEEPRKDYVALLQALEESHLRLDEPATTICCGSCEPMPRPAGQEVRHKEVPASDGPKGLQCNLQLTIGMIRTIK